MGVMSLGNSSLAWVTNRSSVLANTLPCTEPVSPHRSRTCSQMWVSVHAGGTVSAMCSASGTAASQLGVKHALPELVSGRLPARHRHELVPLPSVPGGQLLQTG